jgi:hypothetical protein
LIDKPELTPKDVFTKLLPNFVVFKILKISFTYGKGLSPGALVFIDSKHGRNVSTGIYVYYVDDNCFTISPHRGIRRAG